MAKKKGDYFGWGYVISVILAILPPTSWVCGFVTRFKEGKIVAGLIRLIFGFTVMNIVYSNKTFTDKRQALNEFAFCHFPLSIEVNGVAMTFDCFSALETYILSH